MNTGSFDFATFRLAQLSPVATEPDLPAGLLWLWRQGRDRAAAHLAARAHPAAPSHVSALMSGVMKKTAIYGILRICVDFLGAPNVLWWGVTGLALRRAYRQCWACCMR